MGSGTRFFTGIFASTLHRSLSELNRTHSGMV